MKEKTNERTKKNTYLYGQIHRRPVLSNHIYFTRVDNTWYRVENTTGHVSSGHFIRQRTSPRVYWLFRERYFERITVIVPRARDTGTVGGGFFFLFFFDEIRPKRFSFRSSNTVSHGLDQDRRLAGWTCTGLGDAPNHRFYE